MNDTAILKIKTRQSRSKGANNALTREGYLLGNIVERGKESISIATPKDEFRRSLNANGVNAIYTLQDDDNNSYTVMVRESQLKPVVNELYHVEFQVVSLTEEITVDVLLNIIGQATVEAKGFIINRVYDTIPVTGFPQNIPDKIDVDVTGFGIEDSITVADVKFDKLTTTLEDDELLITISEPKMEVAEDEEDDETEEISVEVPVISEEDE